MVDVIDIVAQSAEHLVVIRAVTAVQGVVTGQSIDSVIAVQAENAPAARQGIAAFAIDCDAPASPNEILICTDADLLVRDRRLASQAAAAGASGEEAAARLQWVRDQRDLCDSIECLRRAYGTDLPDASGEAAI